MYSTVHTYHHRSHTRSLQSECGSSVIMLTSTTLYQHKPCHASCSLPCVARISTQAIALCGKHAYYNLVQCFALLHSHPGRQTLISANLPPTTKGKVVLCPPLPTSSCSAGCQLSTSETLLFHTFWQRKCISTCPLYKILQVQSRSLYMCVRLDMQYTCRHACTCAFV